MRASCQVYYVFKDYVGFENLQKQQQILNSLTCKYVCMYVCMYVFEYVCMYDVCAILIIE